MRQPVRCTWALGSALGTLRESDDSYRSPVASGVDATQRDRVALAHRVGGSLTILISARLPAPLVPPVLATTVTGGVAYPLEDAVLVILTRLSTLNS
jgi:hypothetical protein